MTMTTNPVYKVVHVFYPEKIAKVFDIKEEWMVTRTDYIEKTEHVSPSGFFQSKEDAEAFVKSITD